MTLTHFKNKNKTIEMVDISKKKRTNRIAIAESLIKIDKNNFPIQINYFVETFFHRFTIFFLS